MRNFLVFILIICSILAHGQVSESRGHGFLGFFRMKNQLTDLKWNKNAPVFVTFTGSTLLSSFSYWQGIAFTSYSKNGRVRSTNLFDIQGQLRETRSSVSLRKSGVLSYWRLQFSPQRTHPLLVYTIH